MRPIFWSFEKGGRLKRQDPKAGSYEIELKRPRELGLALKPMKPGDYEVGVVTKDLVPRVSAKELVTLAANVVGGKGGGRADSAQGGGPDAARLSEALEAAQREAKDRLSRVT